MIIHSKFYYNSHTRSKYLFLNRWEVLRKQVSGNTLTVRKKIILLQIYQKNKITNIHIKLRKITKSFLQVLLCVGWCYNIFFKLLYIYLANIKRQYLKHVMINVGENLYYFILLFFYTIIQIL